MDVLSKKLGIINNEIYLCILVNYDDEKLYFSFPIQEHKFKYHIVNKSKTIPGFIINAAQQALNDFPTPLLDKLFASIS